LTWFLRTDFGDELAEAVNRRTWLCEEAVKLSIESTGAAAEKPQTVMSLLRQSTDKSPDHPALGEFHSVLLWSQNCDRI
jgi:hypothetical protein